MGPPQEFLELEQEAEEIGFVGVLAGRLVRSNYRAGRLCAIHAREGAQLAKGREIPAHLRHLADGEPGFAQAVS